MSNPPSDWPPATPAATARVAPRVPFAGPIAALILACGIALGGFLAGNGFARARTGDRYVTVKGVSERSATADLAIWPIRVVAAGDNLAGAHAQLQTSVQKVYAFLAAQGIDSMQISLQGLSVTDKNANEYGGERGGARYVIHQAVVVRSAHPMVVLGASQHVADLVNSGVVLSSGEEGGAMSGGPTFVFTRLNDLKPAMIAEATARAREAAQQFAHDSHSDLGGIRQASQGVFEILPRDQAPGISEGSQVEKTIRVVATVDYYLND